MSQEKDTPKRIAFITSSLTAGGAQGNIINLSEYLSKRNYTIDIICLRDGNDYEDEMKRSRVNIITLINLKKNLSILTLPFILLIKMLSVIRKRKYSLIIGSHEYYPYYFTVFFSKLFGIKSLLMIANDYNLSENKIYKNSFFHRLNSKVSSFN